MVDSADHALLTATHLTSGQVAFLLGYLVFFCLWIYADILTRSKRLMLRSSKTSESEGELSTSDAAPDVVVADDQSLPRHSNICAEIGRSGLIRCFALDPQSLMVCRPALRSLTECGSILLWFYLVDRTDVFHSGTKAYHREVLALIMLALTGVAFVSSLKKGKAAVLLNRSQTEEWKGWMQVLFLLYHYFEAREIYNAIRVFIAAYVWMTGFGNFTYYYKTNDFSIGRFCAMMWRLNFLVALCCVVLNNSYMLYYICPMHTLFTVMVYAALGICREINRKSWGIWLKMLLCTVVVYLCWDIKPVFMLIWDKVPWLVHYVDPRRPSGDLMHEWYFRSSLDRYIWIYGMLCAYIHAKAEGWLKRLEDELNVSQRFLAKSALGLVTGFVSYAWYTHVYCLPKAKYNVLHPYTSWIPITCFIVFRNLTPSLRTYSLTLYGWLGCITLETYIGQFHTWLKTEVADGQPKSLLTLVPFSRPLNFIVTTALYVLISRRLFVLTNDLRAAVVPTHNDRKLFRNVIMMAIAGIALYVLGVGVLRFTSISHL